jgi:hypothetical protein
MNTNNNYYTIVQTIRDTFEENPLVNNIIYARQPDADLFKNTITPLVHISPIPSSWSNEAANSFSFEIGVLIQRTQDNRHNDTKFEGNDNIIDAHNTSYSIINEFLTVMSKDNNNQIYMENVGNIEPIFFDNIDGLDGFVFTADFKTSNKTQVC